MKKIKLVTTVVLILVLVLSFYTSALALETGSITVKNPIAGQTYAAYRIFDLETYDKNSSAYSYILNDKWDDFAAQGSIQDKYINLEESNSKFYVTWKEGADVSEFAALAIKWANDKTIAAEASNKPTTTDDIVFNDLPLGYYLIDSSAGALCALTTNDPHAEVIEKNELTTVTKLVKEDSTNDYKTENSAKIGDTVSFKSEITLGAGTENLVLHDVMTDGLELKPDTIKVYVLQQPVDADCYTLSYVYTDPETHLHQGLQDSCTFEISFTNDFISGLSKGSVIRVEYDAVLSYLTKEWKSYDNETWVLFGNKIESTHSKTTTHTYSLDLLKTNDKHAVIQTAKFYLYDAQHGGNIIPLIETSKDADTGVYRYRVAEAKDNVTGNGDAIQAGYAYIFGLDSKVYYLEEIEQPTGFNKLAGRVEADLTNGDIKADTANGFYLKGGVVLGSDVSENGGLQVINKTGTILPSTGGTGTKLFYACGGILVAMAAVILFTIKHTGKSDK